MGYEKYDEDIRIPNTAFLTCFAWPDEIVPDFIRNERSEWFNVETFNRNWSKVELSKVVPEEFYNETFNGKFSGKWLYLSMGTMGCVDVELMKRLIGMLSSVKINCNGAGEKSIAKLLVSLGPRENEIRPHLPYNCYGERYFDQTTILPCIDLLITHGGNNTVTESISRAVPMLVLPLFADQYDNAQRLTEMGLGMRLDPYRCNQEEFQSGINSMLNNRELKLMLEKICRRIESEDRHSILCDMIETKLSQ